MIQLDYLILDLSTAVIQGNFTEEQKKELNVCLDNIPTDIPEVGGLTDIKNVGNALKFMSKMKKVSKQLKKFDDKWCEFGGDQEKLKEIVKQTEKAMKGMLSSMVGV